ncbi:MAG: tetratricopeptide repeat protein [Candidatus Eremiobacteraeota bacterium]|nr:tetratricopeptide repeat protein [Candidatus Eremiobacteraeota bacterium]
MKKHLKTACLVIGIVMFVGAALFAGMIWYFYSQISTPELTKLTEAYRLMGENQHEKALAVCEELLKSKPDYYPAQQCKGDILVQMKRYDDALLYFDGIAKKDPQNAYALVRKADVQAMTKHSSEALATYESALAISPGSCDAWQGKGDLLTSMGRLEEALKAYDTGLSKTEGMT